ncbi:MAG: ACP S-malonyltransferase [Pseudomonadota bacterium]
MSRTAVVICPGRGTYNREELGYLKRHRASHSRLFAEFDALRADAGQEAVTALDGAENFTTAKYSRGDVASALIYSASLADARSLGDDIDVVAVTGNSMGWYIALAVAGALTERDGFRVVNTMGTLMQEHLIGGQLIYPFVDEKWRFDRRRRTALIEAVDAINAQDDCELSLSIELGGMLALAGNEAGLKAFEASQPRLQGRYPMRLPNHAAFHTALQQPVSEHGRERLAGIDFHQPTHPLIDGRGHTWWPDASDLDALKSYTFGQQVTEPYDFTAAIHAAAREFAPDLFIVTGPGNSLGGAVAQALILCEWRGQKNKADFKALQASEPFLISMGMDTQRALATG